MNIDITLSIEDFDLLEENKEYFEKNLIGFKILNSQIEIVDENLCDGDPLNLSFIEVKLKVQSNNNLWYIAKCIQNFKLLNHFNV